MQHETKPESAGAKRTLAGSAVGYGIVCGLTFPLMISSTFLQEMSLSHGAGDAFGALFFLAYALTMAGTALAYALRRKPTRRARIVSAFAAAFLGNALMFARLVGLIEGGWPYAIAASSLIGYGLATAELAWMARITSLHERGQVSLARTVPLSFLCGGAVAAVIFVASGTFELLFALAISEPEAGSDAMNMQTYTRTVDEHLILNGRKTYVNNGEYAPYIMVAAIDRDCEAPGKYPPMTFWLLPRDLKGVSAYPINKIGQSMLPFATLVFDNVELSPAYRLNGRQEGFRQLFRLLEFGRVFTCASSLGMARAAMEDAVAHARSRKAFGVQIGRFQQIEQMLTDMEVSIYNMSSMLYRAALAVDNGGPDERLSVALMKRYAPDAATEVASSAMQILGGMGYTEGARVSQLWQDCRGNQIAEGTDQIMVYIASPLIMEKY